MATRTLNWLGASTDYCNAAGNNWKIEGGATLGVGDFPGKVDTGGTYLPFFDDTIHLYGASCPGAAAPTDFSSIDGTSLSAIPVAVVMDEAFRVKFPTIDWYTNTGHANGDFYVAGPITWLGSGRVYNGFYNGTYNVTLRNTAKFQVRDSSPNNAVTLYLYGGAHAANFNALTQFKAAHIMEVGATLTWGAGAETGYSASSDFTVTKPAATDLRLNITAGASYDLATGTLASKIVNKSGVATAYTLFAAVDGSDVVHADTAGTLTVTTGAWNATGIIATGGVYHATTGLAATDVWYGTAPGTAYYDSDGAHNGTKRASSITNCSSGNVKKDVVIDNVTGNLDIASDNKRRVVQ